MLQPAYFKNWNNKKHQYAAHNGKNCSIIHMLSFDRSAFFMVGYNQKISVSALQRNYQIILSKGL